MAQKTVVQLVDDLDGTELDASDGETVVFALDGVNYELDLSLENADAFRGLFQDYIAAGRKVTGSRSSRSSRASSSGDAKDIRAWAVEQGLDVPERGRIPSDLRDRYEAAH